MSKKDFIALADHIREDPSLQLLNQEQLEALADFCHSQNPRFLRQRWLGYIAGECGPNGGERKAKSNAANAAI